jgi:uncharacterized protein YjiK
MPNHRIGGFGATNWSSWKPSESGPAQFKPAGKLKLKVDEASDVVALPNGRFAIVGDRSDAIHVVDGDKIVNKFHLPDLKNGKSYLEGVAFDPQRNHLFVAREDKAELLRYEWDPNKSSPPRLEKSFKLDDRGPKNKGVEGLAYLPESISPTGKPQLLIAKEGKPRSITMRDDGGGGKDMKVDLEQQVLSVCKDFSAMAIDPKTGNLFISSDQSSTVAQVKLVRDGDKIKGKLVQSIPLRDKDGKALERVEGLTFDARGNLYALTENEGALHKLERK